MTVNSVERKAPGRVECHKEFFNLPRKATYGKMRLRRGGMAKRPAFGSNAIKNHLTRRAKQPTER